MDAPLIIRTEPMLGRSDRSRRREREDDDTATLSPLPAFASRQPQVGSQVWVVSRRKERASLCEVTGISGGLAQVLMGKDSRRAFIVALPLSRFQQVNEYLWRAEQD